MPKIPQKEEVQSAKMSVETPPPMKLRPETFKPKRIKDPYYKAINSIEIPEKGEKIKKKETYSYVQADMKARYRRMDLEDKAIKYGNYGSIL